MHFSGEFNDSFAYTSNGKKMCKFNDKFSDDDYGESFDQSDVIGCYIDFGDDNEENLIRISFTKNGDDYGQAFEFSNNNSTEFYPHILVKNVKFECNFGQIVNTKHLYFFFVLSIRGILFFFSIKENSWSEIKSDYIFAQKIPLSNRIRCVESIPEKADCQVILLSGLIGSGKTTWAEKYIEENSNRNFNLLNIEHVLSKMAVCFQNVLNFKTIVFYEGQWKIANCKRS